MQTRLDMNNVPQDVRFVLHGLRMHGHQAFLVGGCVRDMLLGLTPKDFDVTTDATPQRVAELFTSVELVGAHFGVSLVKVNGTVTEVATFRKDGVYSDYVRPDSVELTTNVREDVLRRDFTVNALLADDHGYVLDFVGGLLDLQFKMVRAVGNAVDRFKEDPVRMLRAVRFAVKLGFGFDEPTWKAMQKNADLLRYVAKERVRDEFNKALLSGDPERAVEELHLSGLLFTFLPEFRPMHTTPQNPKHHPEGDVWEHTKLVLLQAKKDAPLELLLAALLHDIGKPATLEYKNGQPTFHGHDEAGAAIAETFLRRLKYSNDVREVVVPLVEQHMRFMALAEMRRAKQARFVLQPNFNLLLELHRMDTSGRGCEPDLTNYVFALEVLARTGEQELHKGRPADAFVSGHDLLALGLKPGPNFRRILTALDDLQLEGRFENKYDALAYVTVLCETKEG